MNIKNVKVPTIPVSTALSVGALVGMYIFGDKILKALGLTKDGDDKDAEALASAPYWNQNYIANAPNGYKTIAAAAGQQLTSQLLNAAGTFNDNEEQIYNAFRVLPTKSCVTSLAYWFSHYTNQDLIYWLVDVLNASELSKIKTIIDGKPNYI